MAEYKYTFPLKERFQVAEDTMAFVFDASGSDFSFRAGQYVEIGLENPLYTDEKKDHREFSIASSPNEKGVLMIATRMDGPGRPLSAFKKTLAEVPLGTPAKVAGPFGNFTLHENPQKRAVFIAGGIGITPVRSIVNYAAEEKLPHKIVLVYANRIPEASAFLDELQELEKENQNFILLAVMAEMANSAQSWLGLIGYVDPNFIKTHLGDLTNTIYYLVGPPGMVQAASQALEESGISRDDIRFEEFTGY